MSDLVGNPEDRFSRVAAHIKLCHTVHFDLNDPSIKLIDRVEEISRFFLHLFKYVIFVIESISV